MTAQGLPHGKACFQEAGLRAQRTLEFGGSSHSESPEPSKPRAEASFRHLLPYCAEQEGRKLQVNVRTGAKRPVDSGIGERTNDCPGPSDQWGTSDQWAPRGLPTFFSVVEQAVLHTVAPGGHATSISGWMASRAAKSGTLAEQLAGTDGSCAMALPSRQAASRSF